MRWPRPGCAASPRAWSRTATSSCSPSEPAARAAAPGGAGSRQGRSSEVAAISSREQPSWGERVSSLCQDLDDDRSSTHLGAVTRSADAGLSALPGLIGRSTSPHDDEALRRYVDLLVGPGVERGLIGPREADRIWGRHILNCAALVPLVPERSAVADIGSGAGLPGVVLAVLRPDLTVALIEPLLRRATFLSEVLGELGLSDRVVVIRSRAEDYHGEQFDVVAARAVAPLDRLGRWALPLLRPAGRLLAIKGQRAHDEADQHRAELARLGARSVEVVTLGRDHLLEPTTVVVVTRDDPEHVPR